MSKPDKTENKHQLVIRHKDTTEEWKKDSAGCTTDKGHSTYHKNSGNTTDHYGKIISTGGKSGKKKS
tara:strand:- start:277 stop:477 length:201 start_codon:yes stop_codon:yes gene_type:complete